MFQKTKQVIMSLKYESAVLKSKLPDIEYPFQKILVESYL